MRQEVIDGVRDYYKLLDDVPDDYIARKLSKSLGASAVEMGIAVKDLKRVAWEQSEAAESFRKQANSFLRFLRKCRSGK